MAVNITPLHDRVLVRRIAEQEKTAGGIIIPDTAKEKPQEGEVVAVGSGRREKGELIPLDVKVGDRQRGVHDPQGRRDPRQVCPDRESSGQEVTFTTKRAAGNSASHGSDSSINYLA
jgi:hypothetical protein